MLEEIKTISYKSEKFKVVEAENIHDLADALNKEDCPQIKHVQIMMMPTPLGHPKPVFQALITTLGSL